MNTMYNENLNKNGKINPSVRKKGISYFFFEDGMDFLVCKKLVVSDVVIKHV